MNGREREPTTGEQESEEGDEAHVPVHEVGGFERAFGFGEEERGKEDEQDRAHHRTTKRGGSAAQKGGEATLSFELRFQRFEEELGARGLGVAMGLAAHLEGWQCGRELAADLAGLDVRLELGLLM